MVKKKKNRNVVYHGLYSYRQQVRFITLFPNIFSHCFCILMQGVLKGKSGACKQFICITQHVHFQIRVVVFSCQDKDDFFVMFDVVVINKSNVV